MSSDLNTALVAHKHISTLAHACPQHLNTHMYMHCHTLDMHRWCTCQCRWTWVGHSTTMHALNIYADTLIEYQVWDILNNLNVYVDTLNVRTWTPLTHTETPSMCTRTPSTHTWALSMLIGTPSMTPSMWTGTPSTCAVPCTHIFHTYMDTFNLQWTYACRMTLGWLMTWVTYCNTHIHPLTLKPSSMSTPVQLHRHIRYVLQYFTFLMVSYFDPSHGPSRVSLVHDTHAHSCYLKKIETEQYEFNTLFNDACPCVWAFEGLTHVHLRLRGSKCLHMHMMVRPRVKCVCIRAFWGFNTHVLGSMCTCMQDAHSRVQHTPTHSRVLLMCIQGFNSIRGLKHSTHMHLRF